MIRVSLVLLALSLAVAASGCISQFADFHVRELSGVHVHDIDDTGFAMTVRAQVENPNRLDAQVSDIRFRASTGGHLLGRGSVAGSSLARARSVFPLDATVRVQFADLPADLPARVADGALPLTVDSTFRARTRIGQFDMNLRAQGRTVLGQALEVMIAGGLRSSTVRVTRLTDVGLRLFGVRLQVQVALRNAFPFPVHITRGHIALLVGGRRVAVTRVDAAIVLPARGRATRVFTVDVSHADMLRLAASLAQGDLSTRAAGTLWIEPIGGVERIPFDVATDLSAIESL